MDSLTSAAPDEKAPELASAAQLSKEKSKPSDPLEISAERFNSSVGRLTSNSEMSRSLLNIAKRPLPRLTLRGVGLTSKDAVS